MAITVADNFSYQGGKPLDARMKFGSVSDMVNTPAASLYDGCFAYVAATKKYYSYDSTNTSDPTLGKWTEYSSGGGGDVDPMPAEDMDDILSPLPGVMARSIYNSRFNRSDMYDTNEVLIGKWIDGKPLYQKTLNLDDYDTRSITTDYLAFSGVIGSLGIDKIVGGNELYQNNINYPIVVKNDGTLRIKAYETIAYDSTNPRLVVIRYTKTGDGVTKVDFDTDYSTDETIVGRWIDGKPLYQKVIEMGPLVNNSTVVVQHGISNVHMVMSQGYAYNESNGQLAELNRYDVQFSGYGTKYSVTSTKAEIYCQNDYTMYTNSWIIVRYTKTTD